VYSRKDAFCSKNCSKNCHFSYPVIFGPLKVQIWQIFGLRKFSLDLANESDIVNRQSGGEKLKYVIKFYMGYMSRDIAHLQWRFSIVSISTWCLGHNMSESVCDRDLDPIDHQYEMTYWDSNSHVNDHITWPTRSRSIYPQYIWGPFSRQRLEIRTWCLRSTYRKWLPRNQMVTWPMTSRDPERSTS